MFAEFGQVSTDHFLLKTPLDDLSRPKTHRRFHLMFRAVGPFREPRKGLREKNYPETLQTPKTPDYLRPNRRSCLEFPDFSHESQMGVKTPSRDSWSSWTASGRDGSPEEGSREPQMRGSKRLKPTSGRRSFWGNKSGVHGVHMCSLGVLTHSKP